MIGLWWAETLRLIGRRRWLLAVPAFALVATLAMDYQCCIWMDYSVQPNVWDGVFATLFNWLYFQFIILLVFAFLSSDSVLQDVSSNWTSLTLPRSRGRLRWWTAKVLSLFTASLVYWLLGLVVVFLLSLIWFPYEPGFSQLAVNPSDFMRTVGTIVIPLGLSPQLLCVQFLLYSTLALGVFTLILVTITLVARQTYLVAFIPFSWVAMSFLWQTNRILFQVNLIPRLFFGMYYQSRSGSAQLISLPSSLLYLLLVGVGCYGAGALLAKRADL
jgi:hypothetical protein